MSSAGFEFSVPASNVSDQLIGQGHHALVAGSLGTGLSQNLTVGPVRLTLNATTTVYLVAQATFGVNTMTGSGTLRARRAR